MSVSGRRRAAAAASAGCCGHRGAVATTRAPTPRVWADTLTWMTSRRRYSTSGAKRRAASSVRRVMSSECATACTCFAVMMDAPPPLPAGAGLDAIVMLAAASVFRVACGLVVKAPCFCAVSFEREGVVREEEQEKKERRARPPGLTPNKKRKPTAVLQPRTPSLPLVLSPSLDHRPPCSQRNTDSKHQKPLVPLAIGLACARACAPSAAAKCRGSRWARCCGRPRARPWIRRGPPQVPRPQQQEEQQQDRQRRRRRRRSRVVERRQRQWHPSPPPPRCPSGGERAEVALAAAASSSAP